MMIIKPEQYEDKELLQHVQRALKQWKWVESCYRDKDLDKDEIFIVEALKKNYLLLLMEVRKRNLSLTSEQLLDAIIFPSPLNKA